MLPRELLRSSSSSPPPTLPAVCLSPLQVTFKGENGIDAGGLTREWFSLVSTALLSSPVLRRTENETAYEYYLNPLAQTEEAQAEAEFIGGFLAKALLETAVPERAARHGLVTLGSLRLCTVLCAAPIIPLDPAELITAAHPFCSARLQSGPQRSAHILSGSDGTPFIFPPRHNHPSPPRLQVQAPPGPPSGVLRPPPHRSERIQRPQERSHP